MKKYIEPSAEVFEVQTNHMICESLPTNTEQIDGGNALSKESGFNYFEEDDNEDLFEK